MPWLLLRFLQRLLRRIISRDSSSGESSRRHHRKHSSLKARKDQRCHKKSFTRPTKKRRRNKKNKVTNSCNSGIGFGFSGVRVILGVQCWHAVSLPLQITTITESIDGSSVEHMVWRRICSRESIEAACAAHPTADVFINFASFRSAAASSMSALKQQTIRVVAIIAEGVPELDTKQPIAYVRSNNKVILGPAAIGGIQAGALKIGATAGTIDNIIACKLYRPGSVGFVFKSVLLLVVMFSRAPLFLTMCFGSSERGTSRRTTKVMLKRKEEIHAP